MNLQKSNERGKGIINDVNFWKGSEKRNKEYRIKRAEFEDWQDLGTYLGKGRSSTKNYMGR